MWGNDHKTSTWTKLLICPTCKKVMKVLTDYKQGTAVTTQEMSPVSCPDCDKLPPYFPPTNQHK